MGSPGDSFIFVLHSSWPCLSCVGLHDGWAVQGFLASGGKASRDCFWLQETCLCEISRATGMVKEERFGEQGSDAWSTGGAGLGVELGVTQLSCPCCCHRGILGGVTELR